MPSKKFSKQAVKTAIFIPTSNERIFATTNKIFSYKRRKSCAIKGAEKIF